MPADVLALGDSGIHHLDILHTKKLAAILPVEENRSPLPRSGRGVGGEGGSVHEVTR
ncbi:hypothetical protein CO2235_MP70242 [Cupriavidus oxalaticus]|uniref:Uncharacterized protein n=1 Tax=Cupriavidus oxalaticus TaxID=96344 RepID=A0A375GN04_9BURK|nr:hypothetical protein CO2235_MP70242 [Cupriavidus oxalaticus]